MKIPENTTNVGAYYGNEDNGQWQPNGVIIDSGVAGGIVGSGDGLQPQPVYPLHIPRGHIPGYVMAGAYYGAGYPAPPPDDFADYMWMENEEEFDKQVGDPYTLPLPLPHPPVMQQLEEEALMEQCIEAMLEDEQRERQRPVNGHSHYPTTSDGNPALSLQETVSRSTLNPLAAEFVPTRVRSTPTEEKTVPEVSKEETPQKEPSKEPVEEAPQVTEEVKTEEPLPPSDPPEVSAADIQPIEKKKDIKKDPKPKVQEPKKVVKAEPKKIKPVVVKSETKVQPKKKEVKAVKSEVMIDEREKEEFVVVPEVPKVQPPSPQTEEPTGPKPINYAAAAKANKPKKPTTPPVSISEKTPPPAPQIKEKPKEKKPATQRKNSAK